MIIKMSLCLAMWNNGGDMVGESGHIWIPGGQGAGTRWLELPGGGDRGPGRAAAYRTKTLPPQPYLPETTNLPATDCYYDDRDTASRDMYHIQMVKSLGARPIENRAYLHS